MLYLFKTEMSVGRATKNFQGVYFDRAPALRTVKKWFSLFWNVAFNLNDEIPYKRTSGIDDDLMCDLEIMI